MYNYNYCKSTLMNLNFLDWHFLIHYFYDQFDRKIDVCFPKNSKDHFYELLIYIIILHCIKSIFQNFRISGQN